MNEIIGRRDKIVIFASAIIALLFKRPEGYLLLLCYFIIFLGIALLTIKDKMVKRREDAKVRLAERRSRQLVCIITKIENELDTIEYMEKVRINCEYLEPNGKRYRFKSEKVLGITECKNGDTINVLVDPQDYNNYCVQIQEVVHM
ncbi:MAG: hypothetical protein K2J90_03200 [Lachnospiraceae bacterium]|nr:hypothetical protein [Lachnospiraceae bacterium]